MQDKYEKSDGTYSEDSDESGTPYADRNVKNGSSLLHDRSKF